jgi:hypothetical protein
MHNINMNESENFISCFQYCLYKVTSDQIEKHSKWQFPISHNPEALLQNVVDRFRFIGSPSIKIKVK